MADKNKSNRKRKKYSAPALEKGLDIVEILAQEPTGLTSGEISLRLGRPMGQLFRMLVVLQQRGYVAHLAETECYELTLKIFELSHHLAPVRRLTLASAPLMKRLSRKIHQSCHLVIYYAGKGHIVVQQDSPAERILSVRLGAEASLSDSCSGHVLLAFADKEEREEMLDSIPDYHRKPRQGALKKIITRIRSDGFECMASAQIQGVRDIGFPVFEHSGQLTAVLVVPFLGYLDDSHPVSMKKAQPAIADIAAEISLRLGHKL